MNKEIKAENKYMTEAIAEAIEDNEKIGFRDKAFDEMAGGRENFEDLLTCIDRDACLELFELYAGMKHEYY